MGMGFPEWQVDGIMDLYKYIDEDSEVTNEESLRLVILKRSPVKSH